MRFFSVLSSEFGDTIIEQEIKINKDTRSQSFLHPVEITTEMAKPGESIKFYFVVMDNDKHNNYKSTISETIVFNLPTRKEVKDDYTELNKLVKNDIVAEMDLLKNLKKELTEFEKSLIEKDSLDWRDRKKLEEILNNQARVEEKITELKNKTKNNFEQMNSMSQPSDKLLKKQQELEKLFNEIMPDEIKELYKELNELRDELDKNELQKKLQDLQLSNEDLEKELDRNLEILKQVEFEQQLEDLINQLKKLGENQLKLSKNDDELSEKIESQEK